MSALTTTVLPEWKYMQFSAWSTPYYGTMQSNVTMDMDDLLFASNATTQATDDEESIFYCPFMKSPISNLILMLLYAMVCLIGLFGNTLVIYVVFRFSKMQTVTNLYLINLGEWTFIPNGLCCENDGWWFFIQRNRFILNYLRLF